MELHNAPIGTLFMLTLGAESDTVFERHGPITDDGAWIEVRPVMRRDGDGWRKATSGTQRCNPYADVRLVTVGVV